ncbi:hypothetical protein [Dietzia sp. MNB45]|uniref:hypothetical protein n=1 Tax=Dietzia sp. MNB45 TaxID=3238800 RepID=UPI003F823C42
MTRVLRRSPDESLSGWIRSRQEILQQRKVNPQPIGDAGVIIRSVDLGTAWSGSLVSGGQGGGSAGRVLRVTAIADNMEVFYATAFGHLYVGGSRYRPSDYLAAMKAGQTNPYSLSTYAEMPPDNSPNKRVWLFNISGPSGGSCSLRLFVNAPDTFSHTVEVVA